MSQSTERAKMVVTLPMEQKVEIQNAAKELGVSVSAYVRMAVRREMEQRASIELITKGELKGMISDLSRLIEKEK